MVALVLAGCSGGGHSSAMPPAPPSLPPADAAPSALDDRVPSTAPNGVRIVVALPVRNDAQLDQLIADQSNSSSPSYHQFLTPAQFRAQFGPTSADLATAANTLKAQGFTTVTTSLGVIADAPQATVEQTFGVHFTRTPSSLRGSQSTVLRPNAALRMPSSLTALGANVVSVDGLELANKTMRAKAFTGTIPKLGSSGFYGPYGPYYPSELRQAYAYPSYTALNGAGRTIAVIGPADFLDSDVQGLWQAEGLATLPAVVRRPVSGGAPAFNPNDGNALEIALDIEEAGGSAPGASIVDYQIPTALDSDFLLGYTAIVEDDIADVVTSSFGLCELAYLKQYTGVDSTATIKHYDNIFRQGTVEGIAFLSASGDYGANDCAPLSGGSAIPNAVDFPSSDPYVTGVGGTNLQATTGDGGLQSNYVAETEFGDPLDPAIYGPNAVFASGGGISVLFAKPFYQLLVNTGSKQRTVPDVAMQMGGCPVDAIACAGNESASVIVFDGQLAGVVGTSSASPEFAGLVAIAQQRIGGRIGTANGLIYLDAALGASSLFHDNIPGNNGYASKRGYNYVVGNGTPIGTKFLLDPGAPLAGDTLSASNP
jgi:subtilase family serine protease